jgi:hypothetical protein
VGYEESSSFLTVTNELRPVMDGYARALGETSSEKRETI